MLESIRRGRGHSGTKVSGETPCPTAKHRQLYLAKSEVNEDQATQWTVKGIDKSTLEASRRAARKRGMKFGAWVNEALRAASTDVDLKKSVDTMDLIKKMEEIESIIDRSVVELKQQADNIKHDIRIIHLLMPKSTGGNQ